MPQKQNKTPVRHWLVVRLGHMGDVALTTGVLRYFGEKGFHFHVLTGREWADLFIGHPHVGRVIALDFKSMAGSVLMDFFSALAREYKGWGLLDLHGNLRSAMLSFFWQGPRACYRKMSLSRRAFLLARKSGGPIRSLVPGDTLRKLTVPQRYALALAGEAPPAHALLPRIYLSEEEKEQGRVILDKACGPETSPVALHPFAAHRLKTWPPGYFVSLAALLDQEAIPWVVIGKGSGGMPPDPRNLTNSTSLRETCAVLTHCRALVTGDSGPMHLCTGVKTPVVALFGPTTMEWGFYPMGPEDTVLETNLSCRPCSLHGKRPCARDGECLARISPAEVMAALGRIKRM